MYKGYTKSVNIENIHVGRTFMSGLWLLKSGHSGMNLKLVRVLKTPQEFVIIV